MKLIYYFCDLNTYGFVVCTLYTFIAGISCTYLLMLMIKTDVGSSVIT